MSKENMRKCVARETAKGWIVSILEIRGDSYVIEVHNSLNTRVMDWAISDEALFMLRNMISEIEK